MSIPRIGAHVSVAGGAHRAFENGREAGCDVVQIFSRYPTRWETPPLTVDEIGCFHEERMRCDLEVVSTHASYLINIAASDRKLRRASLDALTDELERARALGIRRVVLHPGSFGNGSLEEGIKRASASVREVMSGVRDVKLCLEVTAGQGTSIGYSLVHLREMIDRSGVPESLGVCLDTCHLFAAGYDISSEDGFASFIEELESLDLLSLVEVIHVNDSKRELGSRVDRHEHILQGEIGEKGFANILRFERFRDVPFIIETPKGDDPAGNDRRNIETLKRLARR